MTETIFLRLEDEDIDVWRPVCAEKVLGGEGYRILSSPQNFIPDGEKWEFDLGSVVLVEERELEGRLVKVAISKISIS
ncbi:MAG: hypothetical protein KF681_07535 [Bdellovibrionaceae bacterium]|nr:hypothetical protein [Pseudobdellovibrionaceae bacterium]